MPMAKEGFAGWAARRAASVAAAAWVNCGLLYFTLRKRGYLVLDRRLFRTLPRLGLAAAVLGVALWLGIKPLQVFLAGGELTRMLALAVLVGSGMALYLILVIATGAIPRQELMRFLKR